MIAGKINEAWHEAHRMPKNATPTQRLSWHLAHAKNCNCREFTPKMYRKLKRLVEGGEAS